MCTAGCDIRSAPRPGLQNRTVSSMARGLHDRFTTNKEMTMRKTKKTEKPTQIPAIETIQLDNVTGGCAACGNPNHKPFQPAQ